MKNPFISFFQIIGALSLVVGLIIEGTVLLYGIGQSDLVLGFLHFFVGIPGTILGIVVLLICQIQLNKKTPPTL